eukprot:gb/GECG01014169.1/.p1 GENE.gb/GECG01014169.1/~~gb/GECG01014169.1/.p1  ORF type:complete len:551 (+),score=73.11 gb/GECG01014169.1/:1-1653(+)
MSSRTNKKRLSVPPPPPPTHKWTHDKGRMSISNPKKPNIGKKNLAIPPPPPKPTDSSPSKTPPKGRCSIPGPPETKNKPASTPEAHTTNTENVSAQGTHKIDEGSSGSTKENASRLSLLPPPPTRSKRNAAAQTELQGVQEDGQSHGGLQSPAAVGTKVEPYDKLREQTKLQEIRQRLNEVSIPPDCQTAGKEKAIPELKHDRHLLTVSIAEVGVQPQHPSSSSLSSPRNSSNSPRQLTLDPQCRRSFTGTANSPSNSSLTKSMERDVSTPQERTQRSSIHSMDDSATYSVDSNLDDSSYEHTTHDTENAYGITGKEDSDSKHDSCKNQRSLSDSQKTRSLRRSSHGRRQGTTHSQVEIQCASSGPRPQTSDQSEPTTDNLRSRTTSHDLISGYDDDGELLDEDTIAKSEKSHSGTEPAKASSPKKEDKHRIRPAKPSRATMLPYVPVDSLGEEGVKAQVAKRRVPGDGSSSKTYRVTASSSSVPTTTHTKEATGSRERISSSVAPVNHTKSSTSATSSRSRGKSLLTTPQTAKPVRSVFVMDDVDEDQD